MKLAVIGTGYIGLVAGACFAEMGNHVIWMDKDWNKIRKLKEDIVLIYEPDLDQMVERNIDCERLFFITNMQETIEKSNVVFIAVGIPLNEDGSADLSNVLAGAEYISECTNGSKIMNKSTVPLGTAQLIKKDIQSKTNYKVHVVSSPEFLKEGISLFQVWAEQKF